MLIFSSKGRVKHGSTPLLAVVGVVFSSGTSATVNVPSTSITITAHAPTITATRSATVGVPSTSIQITAHAPTVSAGGSTTVSVPSTSIQITAHAPTITAARVASVSVPATSITITAHAPAITAGTGTSVSVPATSIAITAHAPTITATRVATVSVPASTIQITAHAPTITAASGASVSVPATSITITAHAPTITASSGSGGDYEHTSIQWLGSTTAGSSYRIYDSGAVNTPINFNTVSLTISSPASWAQSTAYIAGDYVLPTTPNGYRYECTSPGTSGSTQPTWKTTAGQTNTDGTATWTCRLFSTELAAIAQAAGTRGVCVTAVASGIEDGYRRSIFIEYDANGAVVLPRPNAPEFLFISASGLTASVRYSYSSADEAAAANRIKLYLKAEDGAITSFTPVTLPSPAAVRSGTLTGAAPAAGLYRYKVNALAGIVESSNTDWLGPVWISDAVPAAPGNVEALLQ